MKMAMSVGKSRHYRFEEIHGRHFIQTGEEAGLPKGLVRGVIGEITGIAGKATARTETSLPADFPAFIHESVSAAVTTRLRSLELVGAPS